MPAVTATVSPAFRKLALKAVFTIVLFIITYLVLFAASIGLTILCGYAALGILSAAVGTLTIALSIGLLLMGGMITYFLLKFIFARHKVDRSGLTEITEEQEPRLFAMVREIVDEVQTGFPKKIYLSTDVNAAVFYDSSFWSMIFPIRKNLLIGMGLVNSTTRLELKAILAHEFGHFSQRSMKLGSFVYNVNKVIFNMLYDNDSYSENVNAIASAHWFFAIFANIAITILRGVQWVLRKNYNLINVTYMGLSREMEFHADEVAANVTGSGPLISSLLRTELASDALSRVTDAYNNRYQQSLVSGNIYTQQRWMMAYMSRGTSLLLKNGLPVVTEADVDRYSKSKLVIKDQWASHPATEDRIAALNKLGIRKSEEDYTPANQLFQDVVALQASLTKELFAPVTYPGEVQTESDADFENHYTEEYPLYIYPKLFNGYYDRWYPTPAFAEITAGDVSPATLFNDEMAALGASLLVLEGDKAILHQLTVVEHNIKTFDYDGEKFNMDNIYTLSQKLDGMIAENRRRLEENDAKALACFRSLAAAGGEGEAWEKKYACYAAIHEEEGKRLEIHKATVTAFEFVQEQLPYDTIRQRLADAAAPEQEYRTMLASILADEAWQGAMRATQRDAFTKYLAAEHVYFADGNYNSEALELLYDTLRNFHTVLAAGRDRAKLQLLEACAELVSEPANV